MKRFFALVMAALLVGLPRARAEGPDDLYVRIYSTIQEADSLKNLGQSSEALAKYRAALSALQSFQKGYPDWNAKVVQFRVDYLTTQIGALSAKVPAPPAAAREATTNVAASRAPPLNPAAPPARDLRPPRGIGTSQAQEARDSGLPSPGSPPPARPAGAAEAESQLTVLQAQVSQLQADKSLLEAKLKEALAAQPAAVDPRELAKAEEKARSLEKENDLLKVSLSREQSKPALAADKKDLERTQQALAEANRQLAEQKDLAAKLALEKETLEARLKAPGANGDALAALRAENEVLKKQVTDPQTAMSSAARPQDSSGQLAQAQAQIAALQSDKELLRLEKVALESRLKPSSAPVLATNLSPALNPALDEKRIALLEQERDELQKKLETANKDLATRKGKKTPARVAALEKEVATLRARVEVFEARQVPYSAEELALFKAPEPKLAEASPSKKKPVRKLPAGSAALVAEAQRFFSAKQWDKTEDRYLQVLHLDEKNVLVLANLASIQMELNHLDDSEKHILQAVALAPDDAYSLAVLGRLRFRQKKYDEALDALSRAAKVEPQSAEIQNYLGITLSQKGLRGPAETALRKAIQLEPGYGDAHHNLAVIYLTGKPPAVELARWHYQKALAAGSPRNPDLEKMFEAAKTP